MLNTYACPQDRRHRKHPHHKQPLALAIATFAALASSGLQAQGSGLVLEEIIVTAQKQVQTVRDTPIAITAVSGEEFRDMAAFQFSDLSKMTAGLTVEGGDFDTNIIMRGLGTNLTGNVTDRITNYVDGAFYISDSALFMAQFDLERFEVLRGPQGTLYGKASPAGAIVIHTRNPNLMETDGYVEGSYTQRGGSNTQFGVSLPLIEGVLGIRISGVMDNDRSSGIRNPVHGARASSETQGGRLTILFDPNPTYTSRLSYQYTELNRDFMQVIQGCGQWGCYRAKDRKSIEDFKGQVVVRNEHVIWENNFSLPSNHELTAVTFYQDSLRRRFRDDDALPVDIAYQAVNPAASSKVWNQELRLSSSGNDFWDYMVGMFYAKNQFRTLVDVQQLRMIDRFGSLGIQPTHVDMDITADVGAEDWGFFTHNTFHLSERTILTVGARWNKESRIASQFQDRTVSLVQDVPFAGPGGTTLPAGTVINRATEDAIDPNDTKRTFYAWTGTIKLQHDITDTLMGYVTLDRGFRAGSMNINASGNLPPSLVRFDPEKSSSVEGGLKMEIDGGRGELNLAVYYQQYKDFQYLAQDILIGTDEDPAPLNEYVTNAEEVISKGVELEGRYLISHNWGVAGSIAYNDTKFEKFKEAPCNDDTATLGLEETSSCDFKGRRIGNQGNWSFSASSEYSLPMNSLGAEWYVRGLVNYESFRVHSGSDEKLPGYATWDFFTGLRAADGSWDVKLWVKNAFDKVAVTNIEDRGTSLPNLAQTGVVGADLNVPTGYRVVNVINPRTVGVTASYRF